MASINCKNCGGSLQLSEDRTIGTCDFCGSTMTFPKVDDEQRAAMFNRGNHFRRIGEFDKALQIYEQIVRDSEQDAEAHWCCALCRFGIEYVEDPATYEWLPTCHRASFDSFLEDVDYKAALEYSDGITRRQYLKEGTRIAEVQRGILATSQNTEPYDIFICYKESDADGQRTRDSLLAQDIYYQLTEQGRKVFFARITLEDVPGTQYEPYIFAALNSAKVMIVVGTRPEHLSGVWVKNEWSRFLTMMKKDRHKLLLPCYRDMDPYDMPDQLSMLQSYDMSKIGFIQDLIRGVSKVLDAEKKPEPTSEPINSQQAVSANILLKRGYMALEDAEWDRADEFFEGVLNNDPECSEAYWGKVLAKGKYLSEEDYVQRRLPVSGSKTSVFHDFDGPTPFNIAAHVQSVCNQYAVPGFLEAAAIRSCYQSKAGYYESEIPYWTQELNKETEFWQNNRTLQRALRYDHTGKLQKLQDQVLSGMQSRLTEAKGKEYAQKNAAKTDFEAFLSNTEAHVAALNREALAKKAARKPKRNTPNKKVPVPVTVKSGNLTCPTCQLQQPGNRRVCWSCGQLFANGQPGIPYWCGNCGKPGPYDGVCPDCGDTAKVMNK